MITGNELQQQIKTVFGMKTTRSKTSKLGFEIITRNLEYYVRNAAVDFRAYEVATGIMWAFRTGRLNIDAEHTIRYSNAYQFAALIALISDNCPTQNDIPYWINRNESKIVSLLT